MEKPDNFARICVTLEPGLLENRNAITGDFEPPASRRYLLDLGIGPSLTYLSRQPGSSWLVVSKRAVFDRDLHRSA